ncbi:MAG TPA: hypothetical protein VLH13_03980, partial [Methanomassiliicoccales archaeon]|nr:hypothetical protein [Methanomassiliicoccales archaeon]
MEMGTLIASGRMAEIYEKEENRLLKLFHKHIPRMLAEKEAYQTNIVRNAGVDAPFVHQVVEVEGRFGVEFDRVIGPNFLEWMLRNPSSVQKLSRFFAFHHHEMHL